MTLLAFIVVALVVLAAFAMASALAITVAFLRARAPGPHGLRRGEAAVLGAWLEAAQTSLPWGAEVDLGEALACVAKQLLAMPSDVRLLLDLGLFAYDLSPCLTATSWRRFSTLPIARRKQVSVRVERSPLPQLASLQDAICTLCVLAFAGRKTALAQVGVDRAAWVAERQAARSHALAAAVAAKPAPAPNDSSKP